MNSQQHKPKINTNNENNNTLQTSDSPESWELKTRTIAASVASAFSALSFVDTNQPAEPSETLLPPPSISQASR